LVTMSRWKQLKRWSLASAEYGLVQIAVQVLAALAGILIIRSMSKSEYALFAIANSMQAASNLLADLGVGIGVRSIGGRVCSDSFRFGQLINTALGVRRRFALFSLGICLPTMGWMLWHNGASVPLMIGLCAVVAIGVIPLLTSSVFSVSPLLHGEYRRLQKLDFGNALLRLLLIGVLALGYMRALFAAAVGVIGNWVQKIFMRRWALEHIDISAPPNPEDRRELISLSIKSLPNTIFFCFQGQVTLLILTFVGGTTGIANVTALGRVAVLFTVFSVTFANVIGPRFARCQEPARLPRLYILCVGGAVIVLLPLFIFAWFLPGVFLWLLGGNYAGLEHEYILVVAASCLTQIAGVMWNLNVSKAWIQMQAFGLIATVLVVQVITAISLDLHQFRNILIFNLVTAATPIPLYILDAWRGLRGFALLPKPTLADSIAEKAKLQVIES
jgi:O-antigen/teichoic acid export membrane protein